MSTRAITMALSDLERIEWESKPEEVDTPLGLINCSYDEDKWGPYVTLHLGLPCAWFVETTGDSVAELRGLRFYL